jgi:hypothetical protein
MHGPTCIFWGNLTPFSLKALDALVGMATKSRKKVFEDVQCRHCGSQNPAPWIADNKDKAASALTLSPAVPPPPPAPPPPHPPRTPRAERRLRGFAVRQVP